MESAKCKICFRQFSNRKALGGHMRSHMAKLSVVHHKKQFEEDHCSPKFPGHDDQESDTDTPNGQIIRRRSKRACRSINRNSPDDGSVVSVVDHHHHHHHHHALVSVEEAARLLLLLSRDHHRTTREREKRVPPPGKEHDFTLLVYRCETCHKGFQSYQALGGHRASHKKLKFESEEEEEEDDDDDDAAVAAAAPAHTPAPAPTNQRTFKCPFCFKVFESGQAMGGHKKIHMSSSAASRSLSMPMSGHSFIDLNLPAAPEDDNASQVDDPSVI